MTTDDFSASQCIPWIGVPDANSDKYSRGVLGFATGSEEFPGAALLGIDGALHTGIGMVRYVGPADVGRAVIDHRPEVVLGDSRADAWVVGSGTRATDFERQRDAERILDAGIPAIVDAGALSAIARHARGLVIATPHAGELSALLGVPRDAIEAEPAQFAELAAGFLGVTVVVKGHVTHIAGAGVVRVLPAGPAWLAVAGAGDVLAGILGAILAGACARGAVTEADLPDIAATGVWIHSEAARRASAGGPFVLADLVSHVPGVIRDIAELSR